MVVGVCIMQLHLPAADSLKDKRSIIKSLTNQVRQKFNVSVAEVGLHDVWRTAEIGVALVSTDSRHVHAALSKVVTLVERNHLEVILVDYSIEIW